MVSRNAVRVCTAGFAVALLAGCAGPTSSPASSPSAASAPSSQASTPSASLIRLEKMVVQAGDVPAGWKGKPHKADPRNAASQAAVRRCVGTRSAEQDKVGTAHSQDFALGGARISSSATSYRSRSGLDAGVAMVQSPRLSTCFEQQVRKQLATTLPAAATIESASVKITPGPGGGPANVVASGTGTIKVSVNGQEVVVYVNVTYLTGPLVQVEIDTQSLGAPLPEPVLRSTVAAVARRAAQG